MLGAIFYHHFSEGGVPYRAKLKAAIRDLQCFETLRALSEVHVGVETLNISKKRLNCSFVAGGYLLSIDRASLESHAFDGGFL